MRKNQQTDEERNEVIAVIRIAICDDDQTAVSLHEDIARNSLQACGIGYEITTYTRSSNLLYDIVEDSFFYDLILLDIEMPGVSGMEIPAQIKPCLPNVKIIFVTSHIEYAIDAFELSIFPSMVSGVVWLFSIMTMSLLRFAPIRYFYLFVRYAGINGVLGLLNKLVLFLAGIALWIAIYFICRKRAWG